MVIVGAVAAMSGYFLVVQPYLEKQSMKRFEMEARQIYLQHQKRLASQQGESPSSDSNGS